MSGASFSKLPACMGRATSGACSRRTCVSASGASPVSVLAIYGVGSSSMVVAPMRRRVFLTLTSTRGCMWSLHCRPALLVHEVDVVLLPGCAGFPATW